MRMRTMDSVRNRFRMHMVKIDKNAHFELVAIAEKQKDNRLRKAMCRQNGKKPVAKLYIVM